MKRTLENDLIERNVEAIKEKKKKDTMSLVVRTTSKIGCNVYINDAEL